MLIQLLSNKTIKSESVISIRKIAEVWTIKLSNSYLVELAPIEYEWFMTINGNLIEVLPDLSINIGAIVLFEPNETGFIIGWEGEPPIEISQEKGQLLQDNLLLNHQHIILADRIGFLQENYISPNYVSLV